MDLVKFQTNCQVPQQLTWIEPVCIRMTFFSSTERFIGDTVLVISKLTKFAVPVNLMFVIIPSCFVIVQNVVHSLKPGETPRNSASHEAPNYAQRS